MQIQILSPVLYRKRKGKARVAKILVTPVNKSPFTLEGKITCTVLNGEFTYCHNEDSYPAEIVEVLDETEVSL